MAQAVLAGMSLEDYYNAQPWEVSIIIDRHLYSKSESFKTGWEQARFVMSALTDTKSIKFPWERVDLNISESDWNKTRETFEKWKKDFQNRKSK